MTRNTGNGKSGERPANDSGMSPQQVIEMGEIAARTLRSPAYNVAHRLAVNELIEKWSVTTPQEVKTRESIWYELQALGKAAGLMNLMVGRAQDLIEQQGQEAAQEQQEYYDTQGFGFPPMDDASTPFQ